MTQEERDEIFKKRIALLKPKDDVMFRCLAKDNADFVQNILRIITGIKDLIVTEFQIQADMKRAGGAKSVIFDVYCTDSEGSVYDIEVQNQRAGADIKRIRYNQSIMDIETLDKGENYNKLPTTYVIMITENDYFNRGALFII